MAFGKNEMKKLLDITETCLEEMSKKQTHTPAETEICKKGIELRGMLKCELEDCESKEHDDRRSYGEDRDYSRHSIGDRAVSVLEKLMDNSESPYEKEEVKKFMRMIKREADK